MGTLKRRHGLKGSMQVHKPGAAPQPGGRIVRIYPDRALEVIERRLILPMPALQQRAEVRPAEVLRIECRSLRVGDQRLVQEKVVLVGHGQADPASGPRSAKSGHPGSCLRGTARVPRPASRCRQPPARRRNRSGRCTPSEQQLPTPQQRDWPGTPRTMLSHVRYRSRRRRSIEAGHPAVVRAGDGRRPSKRERLSANFDALMRPVKFGGRSWLRGLRN